jgi:hypothetical protein
MGKGETKTQGGVWMSSHTWRKSMNCQCNSEVQTASEASRALRWGRGVPLQRCARPGIEGEPPGMSSALNPVFGIPRLDIALNWYFQKFSPKNSPHSGILYNFLKTRSPVFWRERPPVKPRAKRAKKIFALVARKKIVAFQVKNFFVHTFVPLPRENFWKTIVHSSPENAFLV